MLALSRLAGAASRHRSLPGFIQTAFLSTASSSRYIVHASGMDRLWIVNDIAEKVIEGGGNVAESKASKLGHYFSIMMLVDVPGPDDVAEMTRLLSSLPDLNVAVFEAKDVQIRPPRIAYTGYLTLEGADNPGIVHTITSALASRGLSIERMETDQELAPLGGTMLFRMRCVCNAFEPLPESFDLTAIRGELELLGDSLNCEVTMEDDSEDSSSGAFVFE